jgi:ribosomal protein S13
MDIGCYRGIRHRSGLPLEVKEQKIILELEKEKEKLLLTRKK